MLVVVTIIALFAALVAPSMFKQGDKAKHGGRARADQHFRAGADAYKLNTGTFPTTEQGLQALRTKPPNVNQWEGPYLRKRSRSIRGAIRTSTSFPASMAMSRTLSAYGADGQPGGEGLNADIVSWKN